MKRKLAAIVMTSILGISLLAGCGGSTSASSANADNAAAGEETEVGVFASEMVSKGSGRSI